MKSLFSRRGARRDDARAEEYGVFPHAEWIRDSVVETGRGYVARPLGNYVPYGRMRPIRTFRRRSDADRLADRLTFGSDAERARLLRGSRR